ncbi:MAG: hypothetical protein Q8R35_02800 [bacterium]|nr:hypothetical protein [bacterium]
MVPAGGLPPERWNLPVVWRRASGEGSAGPEDTNERQAASPGV